MAYFSDLEKGKCPRTNTDIPHNVWCGITSYINSLIQNGYFSQDFPLMCPDGQGCYGTDEELFKNALQAEIIGIDWPLITSKEKQETWPYEDLPFVPSYLTVLDFIQFCYKHIATPTKGSFHSYFSHHHYISFDSESAKQEFINKIETIFSRNGIAYQLSYDGSINKILNDALSSLAHSITTLNSSDYELNKLINQAIINISNVSIDGRYYALKDIWDAFERIKTLYNPDTNKKTSMTQLLDNVAMDTTFRDILEAESLSLTQIGNKFFIRHSEVTQVKLSDSAHIDYLFHRIASFLFLLLPSVS